MLRFSLLIRRLLNEKIQPVHSRERDEPRHQPCHVDRSAAQVGNHAAIVPSVSEWARQHGINTIFFDDRGGPVAHGFLVN